MSEVSDTGRYLGELEAVLSATFDGMLELGVNDRIVAATFIATAVRKVQAAENLEEAEFLHVVFADHLRRLASIHMPTAGNA